MSDQLLLLVHACATWFMVGLIWFVQVVHYPLFGAVGEREWVAYEQAHQTRTTFVVLPPMVIELLAASAIAVGVGIDRAPGPLPWIGLALVVLIWLSTFVVQVPLHARLSDVASTALVRRLVRTNWLRTFAWTARGIIATVLLVR